MSLLPRMTYKTQHCSKKLLFGMKHNSTLLAESLAEDGDWSEVIDELDVRLRQSK
jgi:hypothetical protein